MITCKSAHDNVPCPLYPGQACVCADQIHAGAGVAGSHVTSHNALYSYTLTHRDTVPSHHVLMMTPLAGHCNGRGRSPRVAGGVQRPPPAAVQLGPIPDY